METKDKVIMFAMFSLIIVLAAVILVNRKNIFSKGVVDHFADEDGDGVDDDVEDFEEETKKSAPVEPKVEVAPVKSTASSTSPDAIAIQLKGALETLKKNIEKFSISPEDKKKVFEELFTESNLSTMMTSSATTAGELVSSVVNKIVKPKDTFTDSPDMKDSLDNIKQHIKAAMTEVELLASKSQKKVTVIGEQFTAKKSSSQANNVLPKLNEDLSIEGFENVPKYALF